MRRIREGAHYGAADIEVRNGEGLTPLDIATQKNKQAVAELLQDARAKNSLWRKPPLVNAEDIIDDQAEPPVMSKDPGLAANCSLILENPS